MLVVTLETAFLPRGPSEAIPGDPAERQRWHAHWEEAVSRLALAGFAVARDDAAAQAYLNLRARWSPHIARLAPATAYRTRDLEAHGSEAP